MADKIQVRRDTAANWTSSNPTLSQGEPGHETDTGKMKIGDGSTAWNSLGYFVDKSQMYQLISNETVTVGSGGDFTNLQNAFDYAAKFRPVGGAIITINILTGTTISGTVTLQGGDYSHVKLTSADATVTISSTTDFFTINDCRGPRIDVLFDKNSTAGSGFILARSSLYLTSGAGLKNSGTDNVTMSDSSVLNANYCDFSGAGSDGISAVRACNANIQNSDCSGAGVYGIFCANKGEVNATGVDASGAGTFGAYAFNGGSISIVSGNAQMGGSPATTDIVVSGGSIIHASGATGGTNITVNTLTSGGIIFK